MSQSEPVRNLSEYDIDQKFNLNMGILNEAKKRRSSYSEKFDIKMLGSTLPKIKKWFLIIFRFDFHSIITIFMNIFSEQKTIDSDIILFNFKIEI